MKVYENLLYKNKSVNKKHLLDVFVPGIVDNNTYFPVLVFVHGGSWYQGYKELYHELGYHLASKNIVSVIINYRLGNETTYDGMADDVAAAINWVINNIPNYCGDAKKVFLAGHSAGGHLAALTSLNPRFLKKYDLSDPINGCILIDAFGLNMDYVMQINQSYYVEELKKVFTTDIEKWKDAAPVKFITKESLPFLILTGSQTYPYLSLDNKLFKMNLEAIGVPFVFRKIEGKNHMEMITTLKDPSDPMYRDILSFIHESIPVIV